MDLHEELRDLRRFLPTIQGAPFVKQEKKIPQKARVLASNASAVGMAVVEIDWSRVIDSWARTFASLRSVRQKVFIPSFHGFRAKGKFYMERAQIIIRPIH